MTDDDFGSLMMFLGAVTGSGVFGWSPLALANRLNAGRPPNEYRPYDVPEAIARSV